MDVTPPVRVGGFHILTSLALARDMSPAQYDVTAEIIIIKAYRESAEGKSFQDFHYFFDISAKQANRNAARRSKVAITSHKPLRPLVL